MKRREFLKIGTASACLLALTHALNRPADAHAMPQTSYQKISADDVTCLKALVPVILAGALPDNALEHALAVDEVIQAFDRTVVGLSPALQKEVGELMSLLTLGFTRRYIVGVAKPWPEASAADIQAFLNNWRDSRFALLQQGYLALVRVITACWYGNARSWPQIGYPGPPYAKELGLL
ncbi:MAG: hypothetical protein JNM52_03435 [Betaproteobacteria bacterium]|nr:hypothetical protein [Betaproteobacteria bacterium]